MTSKRAHVINEIITTEREYLQDLRLCAKAYLHSPDGLRSQHALSLGIDADAVSSTFRSCHLFLSVAVCFVEDLVPGFVGLYVCFVSYMY